jgi:PST family polysaccharide transporter
MIARLSRHLSGRPGLARVVSSIVWLGIDRGMRLVFSLVVGVWIARHLGPDDFGQLSFATVFASLFAVVSKLGLERIIVRDLVRHPDRTHEILGSAFVLKLVASFVAMFASIGTIWVMRPHDSIAHTLVGVISLAYAVDSFETIEHYFQSQVTPKYSVWARNGALAAMSLTRVLLIKINAPLVAYAWTQVIETVLGAGVIILLNRRHGIPISSWKPVAKTAFRLVAESWPQMLGAVAITIYMRIDAVMLEEMSGQREVGIYAAATRLSEIWYVIPLAMLASVFPSVVKVRETNPALYKQRLLRLFSLMSGMSLTLAVPIAFLSVPLIRLVYGAKYIDAGPVLAVHIWASLFVFLGSAQEAWNVAEGLLRLSLYRTLCGAVINVGLNLVLIPRYGSLGAAWATVVSYAFAAVFGNLLDRRTRPIFVLQMKSLFFPRYLFA